MKKPQGKTAATPGEPFTGGVDLSIVAALAKIAGHHDLSEVEIERLGTTLMKQSEQINHLREVFGLSEDDLNLDLGPLGRLL